MVEERPVSEDDLQGNDIKGVREDPEMEQRNGERSQRKRKMLSK